MGLVQSAYVIARRDFTATVFSKTFLLFLAGPLLVIGISILFGNLSEQMARDDLQSTVAVIAPQDAFKSLAEAHERIGPAFGERKLPELVRAEPGPDVDAQVRHLLASGDKRIVAVLSGDLSTPRLTGSINEDGAVRRQMGLIIEDARTHRALARAGIAQHPVEIRTTKVGDSAGSRASLRAITARMGQLLLFMLTILLAGMLLSNLIEEKSNKIIEVLAAALPIDAIFLGKLFAMLAVSLVGVMVWASAAFLGLVLLPPADGGLPAPAVGWPLFVILVFVYYAANYLLLGALFLGIGSQASSVREVQTLSMPVTIGQVLIFMLASFAVGPFNSPIGIGAAIFPFSSPLAMVARAAQTPELWPHLAATLWQALWVWLTIKVSAGLFRRNVLKSGSPARKSGRRKARI